MTSRVRRRDSSFASFALGSGRKVAIWLKMCFPFSRRMAATTMGQALRTAKRAPACETLA